MFAEFIADLAWSKFIWSDKIWISIGAVFMILGLLGCFVKKFRDSFWACRIANAPINGKTAIYTAQMLILSAITITVISVDYVAPIIAEKFGKTKPGIIISNLVKFIVVGYMTYLFVNGIINTHI